MDGVLIDARDWHRDALNAALALFGFDISEEEHLARYDGLPTREKLEILTETKGLPRGLHPLISALKQQFTYEETIARCRPRFQHEYMLSRLKSDGYLLACASNSIRATVTLMLERARLLHWMDAVLSNEDVNAAKPDPEIYLLAADNLGVPPSQCLVVEDNKHGVAAATAAGARVLEVMDPDDVHYERVVTALRASA